MYWNIKYRDRLILSIIASSFFLTGCSVAPWERGNLAKKQMLITPSSSRTALRLHVFDSKESAQGAIGSSGGGCGCN